MKAWLGVLGRAAVEFLLALCLLGLAGALGSSLARETPAPLPILRAAAASMLSYMPLAGLVALFLSYFTVEFQIARRSAGWLALMLVALLPFGAFVELERLPVAESLQGASGPLAAKPSLPVAGIATERGPVLVWIRAWDGDTALNAVGADFDSPYPRLSYAPRAAYNVEQGLVQIGGHSLPAAVKSAPSLKLVPEAAVLTPWWIWNRLAGMQALPLWQSLAVAGGFGLLAAALRFLARLSAWPLANAFLAAAGLVALLVVDALLSTPEAAGFTTGLFHRLRIDLPYRLFLAACEGGLGLIVALIDLLVPTSHGRGVDA